MPDTKRYRINASQIEVLDSGNKFIADNVEEVLEELKNIMGTLKSGYSILLNETPQSDFDYFQDPNLQILRSSDNVNILYNSISGTPNIVYSVESGVGDENAIFTLENQIISPFVSTAFSFPDSTGVIDVYLNKNGDSYYRINFSCDDSSISYYKCINGIETRLTTYSYTFDPLTDYVVLIRKLGSGTGVVVNGLTVLSKTNTDLLDNGKVEFKVSSNGVATNIYINYLIIGEISQPVS